MNNPQFTPGCWLWSTDLQRSVLCLDVYENVVRTFDGNTGGVSIVTQDRVIPIMPQTSDEWLNKQHYGSFDMLMAARTAYEAGQQSIVASGNPCPPCKEAVQAPDPGPGYRLIDKDNSEVQDGDEFYTNGHWWPTRGVNEGNNAVLRSGFLTYRRKIEEPQPDQATEPDMRTAIETLLRFAQNDPYTLCDWKAVRAAIKIVSEIFPDSKPETNPPPTT